MELQQDLRECMQGCSQIQQDCVALEHNHGEALKDLYNDILGDIEALEKNLLNNLTTENNENHYFRTQMMSLNQEKSELMENTRKASDKTAEIENFIGINGE